MVNFTNNKIITFDSKKSNLTRHKTIYLQDLIEKDLDDDDNYLMYTICENIKYNILSKFLKRPEITQI